MRKVVYSGMCRLCDCGIPAGFDSHGATLFTGDLVTISYYGEDDILRQVADHLTFVSARQYESYNDGSYKEIDSKPVPFIMGIKDSGVRKVGHDGWNVVKVKSYNDIIDGENYPYFNFSYRVEEER